MTTAIAIAAVVLAIVVVRVVALPMLWRSPTMADPNQDQCKHDETDPNQDQCEHGNRHLGKYDYTPSPAVVRVIRLTDDGEFACRCELTQVLYEIRNGPGPELILWYVHGWKHSAGEGDLDLRNFKALVEELAAQQHHLAAGSRRRVVGVYVGWDGAVGPAWLRNLTFWNRKRAADRISQSSVLTKIIAAAKFARRQARKDITAKDLTIMIGHSFGARILYTATSQGLIDDVQRKHPGRTDGNYRVIEGPADLILLLNPAFEASIFTAMHSVRRPAANTWEGIDKKQQPLLLVLGSEHDWATGILFPCGQVLEFARMARQWVTLGHYTDFFTHSLEPVKPGNSTDSPTTDLSSFVKKFRIRCREWVRDFFIREPKAVQPDEDPLEESDRWYDDFETGALALRRTARRQPGNPFIVARTSSAIIDGHNDIWGEVLRKWMIGFLGELERKKEPTSAP